MPQHAQTGFTYQP